MDNMPVKDWATGELWENVAAAAFSAMVDKQSVSDWSATELRFRQMFRQLATVSLAERTRKILCKRDVLLSASLRYAYVYFWLYPDTLRKVHTRAPGTQRTICGRWFEPASDYVGDTLEKTPRIEMMKVVGQEHCGPCFKGQEILPGKVPVLMVESMSKLNKTRHRAGAKERPLK